MRARGNAQRQYQRVRTRKQMYATAVHLIHFCTPERFAVLTADDIARHSGLPVEQCAEMLEQARQGRLV
jgi:hypothetical protein